ncbi:MAG: hypothetical protein MJ178_09720 [Treponemataceae bacterium]|nr:hypothetical protein [Treponemataceae bacterium]
MNAEWSEQNKRMQKLLAKPDTFTDGIRELMSLRDSLFEQVTQIVHGYPEEAFWQQPFPKAQGYHSKTLAYSIWHIFRIEDIVAHTLIAGNEQVLFRDGWKEQIESPLITTGNELEGGEIAEFSRKLKVRELYEYAAAVKKSTDEMLRVMTYEDLARRFGASEKKNLLESGCVHSGERAVWLIDYWCSKDVAGLIRMPFSRHWIMHIEAMQRIKNKLSRQANESSIGGCGV